MLRYGFYLWLSVLGSQLVAANLLPPSISSLAEKATYLLFLQQHVPRIFEQGAEYDVDFLSYIAGQNNLVNQLKLDPTFQSLAYLRSSLGQIEVSLNHTTNEVAVEFDDQSFLRDVDMQELSTVDAAKLGVALRRLEGDLRVRSLLNAMMSLYPAALKQQGFRLRTNTSLIEFLKEHPLAQSVIDAQFKAQKIGFPMARPTWAELMQETVELNAAERTVALALVRASQTLPSDHEAIFGEGELVAERYAQVLEQLNVSDADELLIDDVRESIFKQYAKRSAKGHVQSRPVLTLREQAPYVGLFRGLAGSDCSTSFSFPYVYSPLERTYFIYSPEGQLLGYLMGTVVQAATPVGTLFSALYVHTISGPEISPRHVQLAMHALANAKVELGVNAVLLPPRDRIYQNINYAVIQNALYQMLGETTYDLTYQDSDLRDKFAAWQLGVAVASGYDSPSSNSTAHEVLWNGKLRAEMRTSYRSMEAPRIELNSPLERTHAVLIALDLLTSERMNTARTHLAAQVRDIRVNGMAVNPISYAFRRQTAAQILAPFRVPVGADGLPPLTHSLSNPSQLPLASYYSGLRSQFSELGIALNDELLQSRPYLFYEGHLAAPDALRTTDARQRKRSIEYLITMIKRWPAPVTAWVAITRQPQAVMEAPRFNRFVQSLFEGDVADYKKLDQLYSSGYRFFHIDGANARRAIEERLADPTLLPVGRAVVEQVQSRLEQDLLQSDCERNLSAS